jgi:hypothetical protein
MANDKDQSLALIAAIGAGDASASDISAQLRARGIASVEDLITELRRAAKAQREQARVLPLPIQLTRRRSETPPEIVKNIVQRIPEVPILLDGTMYDPKDLTRFNGQELHFIVPKDKRYLVAIHDHSAVSNWHQSLIIDDLAGHLEGTPYAHSHSGSLHTTSPPSHPIPGPPKIGPGVPAPYSGPAETVFFEDVNSEGSDLRLAKNRGYYDLTDVHSGIFGWGSDWNDRISSLQMWNTNWTVLHEHIRWTGQTLTIGSHDSNLGTYGWNDRASSLETW